jgi:transcriptional regulator with XRE-family HTH domain
MPAGDATSGAAVQQRAIGARLKAARTAKRMTLEDLATASGVTKGYLSKVERGQTSASVAALIRICEALGLHVGTLFEDAPAGEVVRSDAYPPIDFGGEKMTEYQLTPQGERRMQVILSDISPGGGSGDETYSLPSEVEFALVLDGSLTIDFTEESSGETALRKGDAITFSPDRPHAFRADPKSGAKVLWVLVPALTHRETKEIE